MDGPPAPATIMAVRALFQAVLLLSVNAAASWGGGGGEGGEQPGVDRGDGEDAGRLLLMGGIELGLWNWLASSAQVRRQAARCACPGAWQTPVAEPGRRPPACRLWGWS